MYETCFREWYTEKFLKGDSRPACAEEWEVRPFITCRFYAAPTTVMCVCLMCTGPPSKHSSPDRHTAQTPGIATAASCTRPSLNLSPVTWSPQSYRECMVASVKAKNLGHLSEK